MGGPQPLSWNEIQSYDSATGGTLGIWGRMMLREMSEAYTRWIAKGGQQGDIADDVPYINRTEETIATASKMMRKNSDIAQQKQRELT